MLIFKMRRNILRTIYFLYNFIFLKSQNINYNDFPEIDGFLYVRNRGKLTFGNNIKINSKLSANPIGGDTKTIVVVEKNAELYIGNNCGISNTIIFCSNKITIEEQVYIGGNCKIFDTDFHSLCLENRIANIDNDIKTKPIHIYNGAFIGTGCFILKGVSIGKCSVIGAGSVVTKDIPPFEVWAGNPAKFIKRLNY